MDVGIAESDQQILEVVLMRIRVAIQAEKIDLYIRLMAIGELSRVRECQTRAIGVLIGVEKDIGAVIFVVAVRLSVNHELEAFGATMRTHSLAHL